MNEWRRQGQNLQKGFTFPHCPSFKFENTHWLEITDPGRGVSASTSNVTVSRQGDQLIDHGYGRNIRFPRYACNARAKTIFAG